MMNVMQQYSKVNKTERAHLRGRGHGLVYGTMLKGIDLTRQRIDEAFEAAMRYIKTIALAEGRKIDIKACEIAFDNVIREWAFKYNVGIKETAYDKK